MKRALKGRWGGLMAAWTALIIALVAHAVLDRNRGVMRVAKVQARYSFEMDLVYRRWAAGHGGVYVPVSETTPANPYLAHLENRDVTTTGGLQLTLVNPAYMTRQVNELRREQFGVLSHITSLDPLRPGNVADPWEVEVLKAFEEGQIEAFSTEMLEGVEHLRMMRPLITEARCLKCHRDQGYRVGDVRGGISVSVPMTSLWAATRDHLLALVVVHLGLWSLGLAGIIRTYRGATRHQVQQRVMLMELRDRGRQQTSVAELGRLALSSVETFHLFQRAVRILKERLEVELAEILELSPERVDLEQRASVGWPEGRVGPVSLAGGKPTQESYTLESEDVVIVADVADERRFEVREDLGAQGVRSGLSVTVGSPNKPWGILAAYGRRPRDFTMEEASFVQGVANLLAPAIQGRALQAELVEYHEDLERVVSERTERLQKTIQLMAGREVRMAELKEKNRELRRRLEDEGLESEEFPSPAHRGGMQGKSSMADGASRQVDRSNRERSSEGRSGNPDPTRGDDERH